MELLDNLIISSHSEEYKIELFKGDLTDMRPNEEVDILVVSAFPNDYIPVPGTLIGALYEKGISVSELAAKKAIDLREMCSCWLSEEIIAQHPGIQFKRILCFEPLFRGKPVQVVGDIFRSLTPILGDEFSITKVAMPLVACGNQGTPVTKMLPPLLDAAVHWMSFGIPLKNLKIVSHSTAQAMQVQRVFAELKQKYETLVIDINKEKAQNYDIFISYSHENSSEVDIIVRELKKLRPDLKLFLDRIELNPGAAWQQRIFEALEECRKIIAVFSPPYLVSDVCKEEYNIAHYLNRNSTKEILIPIYLYSTNSKITIANN